MSFDNAANNLQKISLASAHTSGSTSLVLAVSGTAFPAPPFRLTAITGATYGTPGGESLTIYAVAAVATNTPSTGQCTLTVAVAEGTTDQAYGTSDYGEMRLTAGTISDLNTAVSTLQTEVNSVPSGILKGVTNVIQSATAGTDYVTPSGSITGTAGGLSTTLAVASGGTGAATLTAHAVLLGEGTATLGFATIGTGGRILVDQGSGADPGFKAVSGDGTLTAAGALTVASIGGKAVTLGGSLTTAGAYGLTLTLTAATNVTLPAGGTLLSTAATVTVAQGGTGDASLTAYAVLCGGTTSTGALQSVASLGTSGQVLTSNGASALPTWQTITGTGTVTSVGLALPSSILTVSGSPITGSGTLTGTLATQTANTVWAGPTTGSAAAPTFRSLVAADLPTVPVAQGGTGDTSLTAYAVLCGGTTSTGAVQSVASVGTSGQVLTSNGASALPTFQTVSGSGTVTSVGLTVPANMSVTGSPITGSGTLAVTATTPAVAVFTSSGSYTAPTGATFIRVVGIASGGGGGGGGVVASGTAIYGGGGGAGGCYVDIPLRVADLTFPVTVTIGAAGTGGAGASSAGGNGSGGSGANNITFGSYLTIGGGGAGQGGSGSNGYGGPFNPGWTEGQPGVNSSITGVPAAATVLASFGAGPGGGAGGGISAGGTAYAGGYGEYGYGLQRVNYGTSGTVGGGTGGNGTAGGTITAAVYPGSSAGGGGASVTASTPGGNGGVGGNYGAGGGGGGAALTTAGAGGTGGAGAPGILMIYAW